MEQRMYHAKRGVNGRYFQHLFIPIDDMEPGPSVFRTRGIRRTYGSGPWFVSTVWPTGVVTSQGECDLHSFEGGWTSVKNWDLYYADRASQSMYRLRSTSGSRGWYYLDDWTNHTIICDDDRNIRCEWHSTFFKCRFSAIPDCPFPQDFDSAKGMFEYICSLVRAYGTVSSDKVESDYAVRNGRRQASCVDYISWLRPSLQYKFDELNNFYTIVQLGIFPGTTGSGFYTAYLDAIDQLDLTSVNTIANVGEAIDVCKALAGVLRKGPIQATAEYIAERASSSKLKRMSNDWLMYRYAYSTTRMDIKEYMHLVQRLRNLAHLAGRDIHSSGYYTSDDGQMFKVELRLAADQLIPESVTDWLSAIGVEPNAANVWDMVPYSFVVDWFLHVSDFIDYVDRIGNQWDFDIKEMWFTYKSKYDTTSCFYRVPGRRLYGLPVYMDKEASARTVSMRVADSVSLILGR